MHICPKCNTNYEGNFCPQCGEKWEDEKLCPKCGKKLYGGVKFCNECGYSFVGQEPKQKKDNIKIYNWLKFVPTVSFALFAILLFIFYATPIASLILGKGFPNESLGNVYKMSNVVEEIPNIGQNMMNLILMLCISVILAGINIYMEFSKTKKEKRKKAKEILGYITYGIYVLYFILGIIIVTQINKADDGMDLLVPGACPICLIIFSLIFAFISVGSSIACRMIRTKNTIIAEYENTRGESIEKEDKKRKEEYYSTHNEPQLILLGDKYKDKRAKSVYKFAKKNYEKAKESKIPEFLIWLDMNKISLCVLVILIVVIILGITIVRPILTSKFRIKVVDEIAIGDSPQEVEYCLGLPNEEKNEEGDLLWLYYEDDRLNGIKQRIEENFQEQEKAFLNGDKKELEKLINEEEKLEQVLKTTKYDYIEIRFEKFNGSYNGSSFRVISVLLEKNKSNYNKIVDKKIKKAELSDNNFSCSDILSGNIKSTVKVSYKDGSYKKYIIPVSAFEKANELDIAEWSDEWGEYKFDVTIKHKADTGYITDETHHWQKCKVCGKQLDETKKEHKVTYKADDTHHWHGCEVCDKTMDEKDEHSFGESKTCSECGYRKPSEGLSYELRSDQQSYCVTGIGTCQDEYVVIPMIYKNKPITAIGTRAFYQCNTLERIKIPSSVTSFGYQALDDCKNLSEIDIHITDIVSWCYTPFVKHAVSEFALLKINTLNIKLYLNDAEVIDLEIPEEVQQITEYAFFGCTNLQSIVIPASVITIGFGAFAGCTNLKTVTFGKGNNCIEMYAFAGCTNLQSIVIPYTVTEIKEGAFLDCKKLTDIYYGGTKDDWDWEGRDYNDPLNAATIYYYSASDPKSESDYDPNEKYWYYDDRGNIIIW